MGCCGSKSRQSIDLDDFYKANEKGKYALSSGKQGSYQSLSQLEDTPFEDNKEDQADKSFELTLPDDGYQPSDIGREDSVSSLDELLGSKKRNKKTNKTQAKETLKKNGSTITEEKTQEKPQEQRSNLLEVPTLTYEPRRRGADKSLVADKWKSEPVLCEPKQEERRPKFNLKLGSVPDIPGESQQASQPSLKLQGRTRSREDLRTRAVFGYLNIEVPDFSRIVRLYVSSTFTDTQVERNALVERVYPKLKEYCREHGYEFQVIDMRWGIKDPDWDDHEFPELCIRELTKCQKTSTGPKFVTLLGQKYGFCAVSSRIPLEEYDILLSAIDDQSNKDLLRKWYLRDDNAIPPEYVLQPISSQFPDAFSSSNKEARKAATRAWREVHYKLQNMLKTAAAKALDKEAAKKYYISVIEQEVIQGMLNSTDPNTECLWFKRTITDLKENITNDKSDKFIDIKGIRKSKRKGERINPSEIDKVAQSLLKNLKEKKISKVLDKSNVFPYEIKFASNKQEQESNMTHVQFLSKLCQDFFLVVKRRISDGIKKREASEPANDALFEEIAEHVKYAHRKLADFHGRDDLMKTLHHYLTKTCTSPFVVHGGAGTGKTSLVAMAAKHARSWVKQDAIVVLRFLGTTPNSANIRLMLRSVCLQLCRALGLTMPVPKDYQELVRFFQDCLHMARAARPIIVLIDSLEQVANINDGHHMAWLPRMLPSHVHVVVSTSNEQNNTSLPALQKLIPDRSCFMEVGSLSRNDASSILSYWLSKDHRQLTASQQNTILTASTSSPTPLFLKLAYEQAVKWHSFSSQHDTSLETTVSSLVMSLFDKLERKHGQVLIRRLVSYLTVQKHGLSQSELEDVLSCDEDVLDEVHRFRAPPIRRIPPAVIARVFADLEPYLHEYCTNGVRVFSWYYRQFVDKATKKYLDSGLLVKTAHSNLADYFYGRWTEGAKKDDGKGGLKDRHVATQPVTFTTKVFNHRKLTELPYHLLYTGDVDKLKQHTLCNYEFLSAKLQATSPRHVLQDFSDALSFYPADKDLALVFETLQLSRDALTISADQLSAQLIGRLSSPRSASPAIARLLRQAHHPVSHSFIPNIPCLNRPGEKLVHSLPNLDGHLAVNMGTTKALSVSRDRMIVLWDVRSGGVLQTIESASNVGYVEFCLDDKHVVASCQGVIRQWFLKTAKLKYEIESTLDYAPMCVANGGQTVVVIMKENIKIIKASDGSILKEFQDGDHIHDQVACWDLLVAMANSHHRYVVIYDLKSYEVTKTIQAFDDNSKDVVSSLALSPFNEGQLIVYSKKSLSVRVFDMKSSNCLHVLGPDILHPTVTLNGRYMLCTNCYNDVSIWNLETAMKERHVIRHPPTTAIRHIVSLDGKVIVTASDDKLVRVWDLEQEEESKVDFEDNKGDHCIEYLAMIKSSIQKQVVTKSRASGPISVWNVITCQPIRTLVGTNADEILVVDETRAVVRSGAKLALVDLQEGKVIKRMRSEFSTKVEKVNRHASSLYKRRDLAIRLAESPRFNTRTKNKTRKFNDCALVGTSYVLVLSKDRLYMKLAALETGEPVAKLKAGQRAIIETIMVSENGAVAVCSCENFPLLVWDINERRKKFSLDMDGTFPQLATADISQNGRYLVDVIKLDKKHKTVVTWDLETGTVKHLIGQGLNVWSVAVSSVSMRLVVTGSSGSGGVETIRIYDLANGEFKHQLGGHTEPVKGVCLSKDGRCLLTYVPLGAWDRSVCLWDIITGCPIASFTPDLPVSNCVLNDDGDQVVMVINKSRPIVSLALTHEAGSRELSVDVSNSYFNHPTLHGAVFDLASQMNWDDLADDADD